MKTDCRALDNKTLSELRKRAVARVQAGEGRAVVASVVGISMRTMFRWLALYRSAGEQNVRASKRGWRPPKLNADALKWSMIRLH